MYKNFNAHITKMLEKNKVQESNPRYLLKLLQDSDNLEKFYSDKEFRNKLLSSATYPSSEYFQLERIRARRKTQREIKFTTKQYNKI